jgi:hypothetical protein
MGILVVKNGVVKKRTKRCVLRLDLCTWEKKKKKSNKKDPLISQHWTLWHSFPPAYINSLDFFNNSIAWADMIVCKTKR